MTDEAGDAVPRDYNFADDILIAQSRCRARREARLSSIRAGAWSYGSLAERVERFGHVLRSLGVRREERVLICLADTIDWPTAFLGASRPASWRFRSTP